MKNEETAKRLKLAMDNKNLTAKQLSDKSGVSEPSISQYVHGTFAPKNKKSSGTMPHAQSRCLLYIQGGRAHIA